MIPVVWLSLRDDVPARGYWDQALVEDLLAGHLGTPYRWPRFEHRESADVSDLDGAVVVLPGTAHVDLVETLNGWLSQLDWVLLVVTADEGSHFPWREISHPNLAAWIQTPRRDRHDGIDLALPVGYTPGTVDDGGPVNRPLSWFFAGQVTNPHRRRVVDSLRHVWNGRLVTSRGFTQGIEQAEYRAEMRRAKVVPAPGGIVSPDSFRAWEAFASGAVPLLDRDAGEWKVPEFWSFLLDDLPPVPILDDWSTRRIEAEVERIEAEWPRAQNAAYGWWRTQRRRYARALVDVLDRLGAPLPAGSIAEQITVIVPTSPIASHPSTAIIAETLASIDAAGLAEAEVLICVDGIRPEQEHYRPAFTEYVSTIVRASNATPIVFDEHQHQARMTRAALAEVSTPYVLFVEHDTPLCGDIDWEALTAVVGPIYDVVRLYHEAQVPDGHEYLHDEPLGEFLPTRQWSQRPHLASTDYYRRILADHFDPEERWMIEDRMHGVAQDEPDRHRLAIYAPGPPGGWRRSTHLDGRGDDPKWTDR